MPRLRVPKPSQMRDLPRHPPQTRSLLLPRLLLTARVAAWMRGTVTGSPSRPSKRRHHRVQPTWMRPLRPGRSRLSRKIPRIPIRMMRLRASPPQHHSPVLPRKIQRLKIPRLAPAHHRRRKRTCLPKPSLYPLKYPKIAGIRGFPRAVLASAIPSRPRAAGFSESARTGRG